MDRVGGPVQCLAFEQSLYTVEVLERAAYRLIDRASLELTSGNGVWECNLRFDPSVSDDQAEMLVREFRKEVLDQKLRKAIREQTDALRNLVLARAFSRSGLVDP